LTCLFCDDNELTAKWTTGRIIDQLQICLIKVFSDDGVTRWYESQVEYLIYRIPVYRPIPYFTVYLDDLTPKLKKELASLDKKTLERVMIEAIGRIFEGIDPNYYLARVRKLLRWRILKKNDK
jgi:hypothetical protein